MVEGRKKKKGSEDKDVLKERKRRKMRRGGTDGKGKKQCRFKNKVIVDGEEPDVERKGQKKGKKMDKRNKTGDTAQEEERKGGEDKKRKRREERGKKENGKENDAKEIEK